MVLASLVLSPVDALAFQDGDGKWQSRDREISFLNSSSVILSKSGVASCPFEGSYNLAGMLSDPRVLQREVFMGTGNGAPATGTVIRFYSNPLTLTGDFDGIPGDETVRAITEVAGPGGVSPCPGGENGDGCLNGERSIEEPFLSSSGLWSLPANPGLARSEQQLPGRAPRTYEIRFTDTGSLAWERYASGGVAQFPMEVWDIGVVAQGEANDPGDDVQMAVIFHSDAGGRCQFNFDEWDRGGGVFYSDRIYAQYFADGVTYDDWLQEVDAQFQLFEEQAPIRASLLEKKTGQRITCDVGMSDIFECGEMDLMSYLPINAMGDTGAGLNDIWGWTDPSNSREYALVGRRDALSFVDVTDPLNPVYIGQLTRTAGAPSSTWRDIKVYKDHAFIVSDNAGNHGMQIFDLTKLRDYQNTPIEFQETARYDGIGSAHNIVINESTGFGYAVGVNNSGNTCGGGLHMMNLANPTAPEFVGCFTDPSTGRSGTGYSHDAMCITYAGPDADHQGKEICFGSNETAISISDVTDKSNPVALSSATYPNVFYTHQGWITDDHKYFYSNDELDERNIGNTTRSLIWDVTDLDDPIMVSTIDALSSAIDHNLYVRGDLLFESNYQSGLRVFNISEPINPTEVAFFDTFPLGDEAEFNGAWSVYPYFPSGNIIVSGIGEGLFVLRLNDLITVDLESEVPMNFSLEQNYPNPFNPSTMIEFDIPARAHVSLTVVDVLGRKIATLVDDVTPAGVHQIEFDASSLSSGTYLYRLTTGGQTITKSLTLVK